jgi:tight adherence protein B
MMVIMILAWVVLAIGLAIAHTKKQRKITAIIDESGTFEGVSGSRTVIDSESFDISYKKKLKDKYKQFNKLLNPNAGSKILLFFSISSVAVYFINDWFFRLEYWKVWLGIIPILFIMFILKLSGLREKKFKDNFPDALNILSGALSSGQSIVHAFEYVGTQLDNEVGKEFGECLMVIENNSVGFAVLDKLRDLAYPNLYYSIKSTHEYVEQYLGETSSNAVAGFSTTSKTRPLIVAKMEEFIRNKLVTIYSARLFNELETFVWQNGRPQAMRMYNDDLVMAFAIGCWVRDTALETNQRDVQYTKAFLSTMTRTKSELNTTIPGQQGYKPVAKSDSIKEQQQFNWILKG